MKRVAKKKGNNPKIKEPQPMLLVDDLLEKPLRFPMMLEEYMLEDFLVITIIACNMTSIIHEEIPQPPWIARPIIVPYESTMLIDLL